MCVSLPQPRHEYFNVPVYWLAAIAATAAAADAAAVHRACWAPQSLAPFFLPSEHLALSLVWGCNDTLCSLLMTVMIQYCHNIKNQLKTYGDELMINDENIWMVGIGRLWNIIQLYWSLASLYLLIIDIYWYIVTCLSFVHLLLVPLHQLNTSLCRFHCNESSLHQVPSWSKVCCLTENSYFFKIILLPFIRQQKQNRGVWHATKAGIKPAMLWRLHSQVAWAVAIWLPKCSQEMLNSRSIYKICSGAKWTLC